MKLLLATLPFFISFAFSNNAKNELLTYQKNHRLEDTESVVIQTPQDHKKKSNISRHKGPIIDIDFIYWVAQLEGIPYAYSGIVSETSSPLTNNLTLPQGQVYSFNNRFAPGFKASLGYDFFHGGFDLLAEYTWIYQKLSDSQTNNPNTNLSDNLLPTLSPSFLFSIDTNIVGINKATSSWDLHFYTGDLSLGRKIFILNSLCLRPHVGLKGAYQKQHLRTNYSDIKTLSLSQSNLTQALFRYDQSFWGIGIRAGLDSSWKFNDYCGLFGHMAFAGLWGQFKVTGLEFNDLTIESPAGTTNYSNVNVFNRKNNIKTIKPVFEAALGLYGQAFFKQDSCRLRLQLAWEEQLWLDQNQFGSLTNSSNKFGDLILQGISAKLRLDF